MNKESSLKIATIAGIIVAAITVFIFTPLSEMIFQKDNSVKIILEKDKSTDKILIEKDKSTEYERNEKKILSNDKPYADKTIEHISDNNAVTKTESTDYGIYINSAISKSIDKNNIAITVVEGSGNISTSISSLIANIYTQKGNSGKTGLLRSSFIHKSDFQELIEGNSELIDKLKLWNYTDYVGIGKIEYSLRKGNLVDGTFVCTASISMSIISANQKTTVKSIFFSENGNGVSETQAKQAAVEKLINTYYAEYSSL